MGASKAPLVCLFDTMHWKKVEVGWLQHKHGPCSVHFGAICSGTSS